MAIDSNFKGTMHPVFGIGKGVDRGVLSPDNSNGIIRGYRADNGKRLFYDSILETGLISGGTFSVISNNSISLEPGKGFITDIVDLDNPKIINVEWGAVALPLTIPTNKCGFIWVYVDETGTPQTTTVTPDTHFCLNNILLGYIQYKDGNSLSVQNFPKATSQTSKNQIDTYINGNPVTLARGLKPHKVSNVLSFWVDKGVIYACGSNWRNTPEGTDFVEISSIGDETTPATFDVVFSDGSIYQTNLTIPPKVYENSPSSVLSLTGTEAVIHYVFMTANGLIMQLGNKKYASVRDAIHNLDTDRCEFSYADFLNISGHSDCIAQIYLSNNAMDFEDATLAGGVAMLDGETGSTISPIDLTLTPQYKLRCRVVDDVSAGDDLSMDINGFLQKYPASGGEGESEFADNVKNRLSDLAYLHHNSVGVLAWVDSSLPKRIFIRSGEKNGSGVDWSPSAYRDFGEDIKTLRCKPFPDSDIFFVILTLTDGSLHVFACQEGGVNQAPELGNIYRLASSDVADADCIWAIENKHCICTWCAGDYVYNRYAEVNFNNLTMSWPYGNVQMVNAGGYVSDIQCTSAGRNIIVFFLRGSDNVGWVSECAWYKFWWGTGRYNDSAGAQWMSGSVISLHGVEQQDSNILCQVKTSDGKLQTYSLAYQSGNSISSAVAYGTAITGEAGWILKSDSGVGYNLIINPNQHIDIYEGHLGGDWDKVYTSIKHFIDDPCEWIRCVLFGSTFAYIVHPDVDVNNYVYFIDSNITRTDHFIAVASHSANNGDLLEADIALPIIVLPRQYSAGLFYYHGPYKYQVITHNQAVIIIEATTMMV